MRIEEQPVAIAPERCHECDLPVAIGNRIRIAVIGGIAPGLPRFHLELGDAMVWCRVRVADEDSPLRAIGGSMLALSGYLGAENHAPVRYHRGNAEFGYLTATGDRRPDCGDRHGVSAA